MPSPHNGTLEIDGKKYTRIAIASEEGYFGPSRYERSFDDINNAWVRYRLWVKGNPDLPEKLKIATQECRHEVEAMFHEIIERGEK